MTLLPCMSLEARVTKLEEHHKQMDANLHSLVKVIVEIKNIAMANQHDIAGLKSAIAALAEATLAGFRKVDEQHNAFVKETHEQHNAFVEETREQHNAFVKETHEQHNAFVEETREQHNAFVEETREQHNAFVEETREQHNAFVKETREQNNLFAKETRERFDQLELLIRQFLPSN